MEKADELIVKVSLDTEEFDKNFEEFKKKIEFALGLCPKEKTPEKITGTLIIHDGDSSGRQYFINYFLRADWLLMDYKLNEKGEAYYLIGTTEHFSTHEEFIAAVRKIQDEAWALIKRHGN